MISILLGFNVFGQETEEKDDLKIGLVLSGGGAKGLAHIGALKVIEESGIHIDYIGGTSMGAVIGSLYASGYSANQLDSIFRKTNFRTLIQDDLPRGAKNYFEKQSAQKYIVTLPFDDFKLRLPSSLSKGQNIYNLLSQLTYPVKDIENFENLPIPFLCIGTDIETGERLLLENGSLAQAVAASAAIPSLFKPVEINGRMISDGGITDNYPIEEIRKRGMDYIIGVDVQDSLVDGDHLKTVFEIMTQVGNFRTIRDMKNKRPKTDLYIKPDISEFTILSFDKGDEIVKSGEEGALKVKDKLDSLAELQIRYGNKQGRQIIDSLAIGDIEIKGNVNHKRNFIRGKLKIPTHQKVSFEDLNEGFNNLSASGDFERIQYELLPQENGFDDLKLMLKETQNRSTLRFGLHYDGLYKSGALINFTHKRLIFNNDMISFDLVPGETFRYKFDYFIDKGLYWSLGLRSAFNQFDRNIRLKILEDNFESELRNNKTPFDYYNLTNQLYAETFFLNLNAVRFRAGLEHNYTKVKSGSVSVTSGAEEGESVSLFERIHTFGPYGFLEYDSYDDAYFPSKGFYFRGAINAHLFKSQSSFDFNRYAVLTGGFGIATSPFDKVSLRLNASAGFHLGNTNMVANKFFLGGFGNNYGKNIVPFFGYSFLSKA
ncbi:MAG TPA: patatin-like phospholipase family protein, partial [Flavobacteriaceae bacterium]|nr:patatin-like phospholipase family protein [Flavobacteriaceae bacterium]